MGAVISRLQLVDRTQLLIGCGTAAVILLYFRLVGRGGDHKPRGIRCQQDELFTSHLNYTSLPHFVSEESFASEKTGVSFSPSSAQYPAEEYNYFVVAQDGKDQPPIVAHPRSIPTIQATTLYRSLNSDVGSQTCHRDFNLPPPHEDTKRNAPTQSTNQKRPTSKAQATTTQTCRHDSQSPELTTYYAGARTSQRRREVPAHEPMSMATQTCRFHHAPPVTSRNLYLENPESRDSIFAVPHITVASASFPYPSLPNVVPDDGVSGHVINQQSDIHEPFDTTDFLLPLEKTESDTTDTDKQVTALRKSTVTRQTSVMCHHHYQLPEIPLDDVASASTQTGKMKSVIATQTSVVCHHHFELPENVASVTTQTEKLKTVVATQTSVICHHHYQLPILPSVSSIEGLAPTTKAPYLQDFSEEDAEEPIHKSKPLRVTASSNKPKELQPTQTSSYQHDQEPIPRRKSSTPSSNKSTELPVTLSPSYLPDFSEEDAEEPIPRSKPLRVTASSNKPKELQPTQTSSYQHDQDPIPSRKSSTPSTNKSTELPVTPTSSYLADLSDNDRKEATSPPRRISVRIAPNDFKIKEESSDSDYFEPKIIDSKPSMKVEDQRLYDHDTLPEIRPSTDKKLKPKTQPRSRHEDTSRTNFWAPVRTPTTRPKPDKGKGKPRKIIIERQPQEDGQ